MYTVIDDIFFEEGVENPYAENEFRIEVVKCDEEFMVIKIVFPEPEEEPLCYCSYLFVDKEMKNLKYFCIEKANGLEIAFVCSRTDSGQHMNYGNCSMEDKEDYERCLSIYSEER